MRAYEEYSSTQEICFPMIPAHWNMWKIKHLFTERIEKGFPKEQLLVASQNHGVIPKREYETRTVEATKDLHLLKLVKQGDFVISLRSFQGGIEYAHCQGIISPAYTIMIPQEEISPAYFRLLAKSFPFIEMLKQCVTGIREGQNIDYNKLKNRHIPLPPRKEQDAIVRFLDAKCAKIDRLIKLKERQIELLNEKKQNIINQAVTKGLDPHAPMKDSGVDWIGDIPKEIVISRVGLHYEVILGKMLCPSKQAENFSLEPYYCAANVHFEGISSENLKEMWFSPEEKIKYTVQQNDLLIVEGGAGAGGCAIVTSETPKACIQNSIMIVRNPDGETRYLGYLIESLVRRGYIDFVCQKATIPHFTKEKLCVVPYPVFSKEERCKIADYLDNITTSYQRKTALVQKEISILQEYKTRIISDVVTGKVVCL